ncbi:hypothetical protein ABK35_005090 [Salmonella enterica subsp. salamae]|nr:hypothetical protein [Salmonella enterica]ECJ2364289.1 hypothetical protein [Salmonella enterica subsp. diarizonae]ECJ2414599.1 hypothetical protein [Salmonella enterica subsp. diarizonae]EDW6120826.1 hypothetical protein [Salmonella enterica subsp. salamae]
MQLPETVTACCGRTPGADKPVRARQGFGGFRGAALNQSRSASEVYTGLGWCHERDYQESTWQECLQHQCVRWLMPVPWICRLLAHSVATLRP